MPDIEQNFDTTAKLKIAIVLHFNSPFGGLHHNIQDTLSYLHIEGHAVNIYCPGGPFSDMLRNLGYSVDSLEPDMSSLPNFDIVHMHPGPPSITLGLKIAKQTNASLFITYHGRWLGSLKSIAIKCAGIFGVSRAICDAIHETIPKSNASIYFMPNGIDPHILPSPSAAPNRTRKLNILVASRFSAEKAPLLDLLFDIWGAQARRQLKGLCWHIAGTGPEEARLRSAVDALPALKDLVIFHGWLDQTALAEQMNAADVAVAPGRSAIETMARGIPTVAVGSGGVVGLVTTDHMERAAYSNFGGAYTPNTVTPKDVLDDLIALQKWQTRKCLGDISRDYVLKNFDSRVHHTRLMDIYRAAVNKKGKKPLRHPSRAPKANPRPGLLKGIPHIREDQGQKLDLQLGKATYQKTAKKVPIRFFYDRKEGNSKQLLVLLPGAHNRSRGHIHLQRHDWSDIFEGYAVASFSDPTLRADNDVSLGWFQNSKGRYGIDALACVVSDLIEQDNIAPENVVFFGSSGGGFVALQMADRFPFATIVVCNPQTLLFKYDAQPFQAMLQVCYPDMSAEQVLDQFKDRMIVKIKPEQRKAPVFIFQNQHDKKHLENHVTPLINELKNSMVQQFVDPITALPIPKPVNIIIYDDPDAGYSPPNKEKTKDFIDRAIFAAHSRLPST